MSLSSNVSDVFVEPERLEDKENDDPKDTDGQTSRLWVDRFSPRRYTELLSDDVSFDFSHKISGSVRRSCNDISCVWLFCFSLPTAVCSSGWNFGTLLCSEERGSPALLGLTDRLPTRTHPKPINPISMQTASRVKLRWPRSFWRLIWTNTNGPNSK